MTDDIDQLLKLLRLKGMSKILDEEMRKADKESMPFRKLLARLLRANDLLPETTYSRPRVVLHTTAPVPDPTPQPEKVSDAQ